MKLNVFGSVLGQTGYDSHCRGLIEGLVDAGCDVHVETPLPAMWDRSPNLSDKLINVIRKDASPRSPTVMITQPIYWGLKLSDRPEKFFGFLIHEGDCLPTGWSDICNDVRVTKVLVPSLHTKDAALKSGVKEDKIVLVQHGVNVDLFKEGVSKGGFEKLKDGTTCNFLFAKGWSQGVDDRSGFDILHKAYNEEFVKGEPVKLVAHINAVYNQPTWNFGQELVKAGCKLEGAPLVHIQNQLPFKNLPDLYNTSDFVMSASKAEAFNLTILEGMACSLIPIVPKTGAEMEYVNETNGFLYGYETEILATGGFLYDGVYWKLPSKDALKRALRKAFELWQDKEKLAEKKKQARLTAEKMTWKDSAKQLLEAV